MAGFTKHEVQSGFANNVILLYGRAKVGKTTLASFFEKPVYFATESGHGHLKGDDIDVENCSSWSKFLDNCSVLANGKHDRKTVIIDTVDNLVDYCSEQVCSENGIGHPSELPMGKGWSLVTTELKRAMMKLASLPYTLVMISHSTKETIETATGKKYDRWSISISGKNKQVFLNMSDLILFIDFKVKDGEVSRVIRTRPDKSYEAGDRSNKLDEEIPFDDPSVAYKELKKQMEV